jgi:anti-sigma regulatory factor (Ser/Thr protein kinase)
MTAARSTPTESRHRPVDTISGGAIGGVLRVLPLLPRRHVSPGTVVACLPAGPEAPMLARRMTSTSLVPRRIDPGQLEDVLLVVSELVTNVVRHGGPMVGLRVRHRDGAVEVEVTDQASGVPVEAESPPVVPSGRGLAIVSTLCRSWGVVERDDAKTVWCRLEPGNTAPPVGQDPFDQHD